MAHSYTNLLYHIVFATKGRRAFLKAPVAARLHDYLRAGIREEGGSVLIINGTADHVRILARLRQDKALSDVVRSIKANSSKWIHKTFPPLRAFAWQVGYGAFTVSESQAPKAHHYIQDQERHHRRSTFEQEFIALLRAHGIAFDAEYVLT